MFRSLILFLAACTGFGAAAGSAVIWLDVPFVKQEKNGCGAACLSMILQYWANQGAAVASEAANALQIQRTLYRSDAQGIWAADMERYLQSAGFRTFAFRGDWQALEQHLAKGRPLIVSLRMSRAGAAFHCVVVAGLDERRHVVLVNDPAGRKLLKLDRAAFEKAWKAAGNWTVLAVPGMGR